MNSFASAATAGCPTDTVRKALVQQRRNKLGRGKPAAWRALDRGPQSPDVVAEEARLTSPMAVNPVLSGASWKLQGRYPGRIKTPRSPCSATEACYGASGTDNWGQRQTSFQTLWYALGSFLLGHRTVDAFIFNDVIRGLMSDENLFLPRTKERARTKESEST